MSASANGDTEVLIVGAGRPVQYWPCCWRRGPAGKDRRGCVSQAGLTHTSSTSRCGLKRLRDEVQALTDFW